MQSEVNQRKKRKKTIYMGLFLAVALLLSYIETLIPFGFGIPGIKLGLTNLLVILCLYHYGVKEALGLNVMRIVLAGFLFGNLYSILYSMAGGLCSFLVMWIAYKTGFLTEKGVSVLGGVFHNLGQIVVAAFVVQTPGVFYYVPWLLMAGVLTGWLLGFAAEILSPYMKKIDRAL